jgi:hypothetical protein
MRYPVLASLLIAGCRLACGQTSSGFEVASVKQLDQTVQPGRPGLSFVGTSGKPFHRAAEAATKLPATRSPVLQILRGLAKKFR